MLEYFRTQYQLNRDKRLAQTKKWHQENREKSNAIARNHRHKRRANGGSHTFEQWEELKRIFNYTCFGCKRAEPEIRLTEDHKVAVSKSGKNSIDNIQPLCLTCNQKKSARAMFPAMTLSGEPVLVPQAA
jgi:5-methylcytosine-specific restriction endonuclease McrA